MIKHIKIKLFKLFSLFLFIQCTQNISKDSCIYRSSGNVPKLNNDSILVLKVVEYNVDLQIDSLKIGKND